MKQIQKFLSGATLFVAVLVFMPGYSGFGQMTLDQGKKPGEFPGGLGNMVNTAFSSGSLAAEKDQFDYLYPCPQMVHGEEGGFNLGDIRFYLSQSFYDNDRWVLDEIFVGDHEVSLLKEEAQTPAVFIGNLTDEMIRQQAEKLRLVIPADCYKAEGYILVVRDSSVVIAGGDDRGTFYGVQTLRQLVENSPSGKALECVTIYDWPALEVRSLHYLHCNDYWRADKTEVNFNEELGREVVKAMGELKMNMIILTLGNSIEWQSHPEISLPGAWSIDKFREFVQYIRKYHIEIVPELNLSPCHDSWLGKYHALVGDPVYFQTIQDLISETVDIIGPPVRYFHLGMDEESTWHAQNMKLDPPIVRPPADRIESLGNIIRFLESKNIMGMIWADIILTDRPGGTWLWELYDDNSGNARMMKERVVHVDWHPYERSGNFRVTEELIKRDFNTLIASWYRAPKENGLPLGVAKKAYELKENSVTGVMQTIWPSGMNLGAKPVYQAAGSFWNPFIPGMSFEEQKKYMK